MALRKQVLSALQQKQILLPETVAELESVLKERDVVGSHPFTTTTESGAPSQSDAASASRNGSSGRLEKRQIEQRIEEDRERHKRLRESIWAISGEGYEELEKLWEEESEIGEDDHVECLEDMEELRQMRGTN